MADGRFSESPVVHASSPCTFFEIIRFLTVESFKSLIFDFCVFDGPCIVSFNNLHCCAYLLESYTAVGVVFVVRKKSIVFIVFFSLFLR